MVSVEIFDYVITKMGYTVILERITQKSKKDAMLKKLLFFFETT